MSDYIIRPWKPEDRPQLKELWQIAFGDSEAYIESFYDAYLREGTCVVAEADGRVVSAMYLIRGLDLYLYRKHLLSAGYTYALATRPEYRGRGIGAAVYRAASDAVLAEAQAAGVLPAEAGLYPFYEKAAGARPVSFAREARFTREELLSLPRCQAARVPGFQYGGFRENLLSGLPHAIHTEALYDFLEDTGFDLFVMNGGVAAARTEDGVCLVPELLVSKGSAMEAAAAIAAWCPAEEYIIRTPLFFDGPGEPRPFVLAALKEEPGYLLPDDLWWGFGLD